MMSSDEVNDTFAEMTAGFEPIADLDFTALNKAELLEKFSEVYGTLTDHNAAVNPITDEDKALKEQYYALLFEMKKRGMK